MPKPKRNAVLNRAMWQGAKIGAVSLGIVGFASGLTVCIAYHLPVPPIAVTEIGVLGGGCLGALGGYASCFAAGRSALKGMLLGAVVGLPVAGLIHGAVSVLAWMGCVALGTLVGYQAGCVQGPAPTSDWKLHG